MSFPNKCVRCGSYAINPHLHGRSKTAFLDLCDVCYWRCAAEFAFERAAKAVEALRAQGGDWTESHLAAVAALNDAAAAIRALKEGN